MWKFTGNEWQFFSFLLDEILTTVWSMMIKEKRWMEEWLYTLLHSRSDTTDRRGGPTKHKLHLRRWDENHVQSHHTTHLTCNELRHYIQPSLITLPTSSLASQSRIHSTNRPLANRSIFIRNPNNRDNLKTQLCCLLPSLRENAICLQSRSGIQPTSPTRVSNRPAELLCWCAVTACDFYNGLQLLGYSICLHLHLQPAN